MKKLIIIGVLALSVIAQAYSTQYNITGDYDQDGYDDIAIWAPEAPFGGHWNFLASSTGYTQTYGFIWGLEDDIPVVGDFDHDGFSDVTVFRELDNTYYVLKSSCGWTCYVAISGINIYQ